MILAAPRGRQERDRTMRLLSIKNLLRRVKKNTRENFHDLYTNKQTVSKKTTYYCI